MTVKSIYDWSQNSFFQKREKFTYIFITSSARTENLLIELIFYPATKVVNNKCHKVNDSIFLWHFQSFISFNYFNRFQLLKSRKHNFEAFCHFLPGSQNCKISKSFPKSVLRVNFPLQKQWNAHRMLWKSSQVE